MQVLLKEKTLNTEQLLKQHTELKEELASEKKSKQTAESAASKLKKSNEGMQKRVGRLEEQVAQLQRSMALLLKQQQPHTGGIASDSTVLDTIVTRSEMNALNIQVSGLEKQLGMWNKAMKEVQQPGGGKGNGNGIPKKRTAGGGPAATLVEEDPVRARAVAMLRANKPGGEAKSLANNEQRQQQPSQPPKKRVRLIENQQQLMKVGGSAGGSEAAPSGFADVAIAALRAVMGADAEQQPPSKAAVQDAVTLLGSLRNKNINSLNSVGRNKDDNIRSSAQKRNIVAAFACAVLECAAAAPACQFAAPALSPKTWFENSATVAGDGRRANVSRKNKRTVKEKESDSLLPSFLGVWCSPEVLQRHSLPWLLHCAVEISAAGAGAAEEEEENGEAEEADVQNLSHVLAQDLALLVIKDLATSSSPRPSLHSPTELCAAGAAAGALWRSHGDSRSFQTYILDILISKLGNNEVAVLAPIAAAIDSWPEALFPNKGALGRSVHQLLQYACTVGKSSRLLEIRLAATWLQKVGVQAWEWKEELRDEEAEAGAVEARKQLEKFLPT